MGHFVLVSNYSFPVCNGEVNLNDFPHVSVLACCDGIVISTSTHFCHGKVSYLCRRFAFLKFCKHVICAGIVTNGFL